MDYATAKGSGLLILAFLIPGCAAKKPPAGTAVEPAPGGKVAVEVLPDPTPKTPELAGRDMFLAPLPLETPLPSFPEVALVEGMEPVVVVVRVVIDEKGGVLGLLDSPAGAQPTSGAPPAFKTTVEEAVRRWKYQPATIRSFVGGEDINHDGLADVGVVMQDKAVRSYLDLRFTFEVVDGRGRVSAAPKE